MAAYLKISKLVNAKFDSHLNGVSTPLGIESKSNILPLSGILKETTTLGRGGSITLLAKLRHAFYIQQNDPLLAEQSPEGILLRPSLSVVIEFDSEDRIAEFASKKADLRKRFAFDDAIQI